MFVITNRQLHAGRKGLARLGHRPNEAGPNELRVVQARRRGRSWSINILPDRLTARYRTAIDLPARPTARERNSGKEYFASHYAAQMIFDRVNPQERGVEGRNLVFFVHGYNNDLKAVLDRAEAFEQQYGVECLVFSWPANGGGLRGVTSYLSDKRDAQASAPAFNRVLEKMHDALVGYNNDSHERIARRAVSRFPNDRAEQLRYVAERMERRCPFRVTMVAHSMGNYVLKQALRTTTTAADRLIFDNVVLAAADTNNLDHGLWVDRLNVRNRVYVTINEDDFALGASRMKIGDQQLARLGHSVSQLNSVRAFYVDFTGAPDVGRSHAYFEGSTAEHPAIRAFFHRAFNGERAETHLPYDAARNTHDVRFAGPVLT
ncbi:MAG: alpha/beta hydrolase [Phycisphaerales bacterium]